MCIKNFFNTVNRMVAGVIAVLICLTMFFPIVAAAKTGNTVFNYDAYSVEYTIVNEWSGYQNIEITLTNTGAEPIYNWMLAYDFCGEIQGMWNEIIKNKSAYFVC